MAKKLTSCLIIFLIFVWARPCAAQIDIQDAHVVQDIALQASCALPEIAPRIGVEYASVNNDTPITYPSGPTSSAQGKPPRIEVEYASIITDIELTYPADVIQESGDVPSRIEVEYASSITDIYLFYPEDVLTTSEKVSSHIEVEYASVITDLSLTYPDDILIEAEKVGPRTYVEYASVISDLSLGYPLGPLTASEKVLPRIYVEYATVISGLGSSVGFSSPTIGVLSSVCSHWYNWASTFEQYKDITSKFEFVRDGAWWSQLEPSDYASAEEWAGAPWSYPYTVQIANCNQSVSYTSGYDGLVQKFQSPKAPSLLLLLDVYNPNLSPDPNNITYDQYYDYVYRVVERYDGDGIDDMPGLTRPVTYFEIGNEVDNPLQNHGLTLENYVLNRLIPGYLAAKAANPNAVVINAGLYLGGDTGFTTSYLDNMLSLIKANGGDEHNYYTDRLAIHYYYDPQNPEYIHDNLGQVKSAMSLYGLSSKAIWITEFGIATKNDSGGQIREIDQAAVLVRYLALMDVANVERSFVYSLKDLNTRDPGDWENVYGIYKVSCEGSTELVQEKESVEALKIFRQKTRGLNLESLNSSSERASGIYIVSYGNVSRKVHVLWYTAMDRTGVNPNLADENKAIVFDVGPNSGILTDMFGNIIDSHVTGKIQLPLNERPIYLEIDYYVEDKDSDGLPDDWEVSYGLNPNDPSDAQADYDNDSLSNLEEYLKGTDPRDSDSDDDGMPDGWEDRYGLDPTRVDSFVDLGGDGLTNLQEYQYWTDPNNADTDGDGVSDGQEVANGTDPRAISSSLTSNISEVDLSIGSTVNVTLTISNKNTTKDTFNLSVAGVDQSWYTLDQSTVLLGAGEDRDILLKLHISMDCTVAAGDYSVEVSAISPESGPVSNGGASLMLHIVNKPVLSNLYPSDGDTLGTNSVQISWRTDIESSTDVYYRILGETEYTHISGEPGTYHSIRLDDLKWDRVYEWYVESAGTCETARSENRTFRIQEGVVFENTAPEFQIARDYDQRLLITVRNLDVVAHSVLVAVLNPYDDLIAGFLGSGSQDKSLILDSGKSSVITLAVHAQDSKAHQYYLPFVLTADGEADNPIVDYAVAKISVVDPVFDFSFVEVARDAATFTNTYRLINNGDTITDLNVYAEESAAPNIVFQPRIEHMTIGHGESIEFKATYQAPEGVSQYTGVLTATGAGKTVTISTHFGCEENDSLFYSTLSDTYICLNSSSWYCTNRPNISVTLVTPKGLKREDITRARVYVNYTLTRPRSSYRLHDVTMKFNGAIIQTWRNTIPEGPYAIEVPASLIRTGEDSTGYNKISLETVHMNGGHYAVASDFQLILDVDEFNVGPICATTQEEADQSAQTLPFVCDGTSRWEVRPQLESFTVLDSNGTPKWNFNPGDNVQFSITVTNPDLKEKAFNVGVLVDDDFDSGDPSFETGQSVVLGAGKSETLTFGWQIPIDTQAKDYSVKVVLSYSTEWEEETLYPKAVKINQPLTGTVMDNEVEGHGLGGVLVCASWLGEAHLEDICTTTDQDGNFTLLLPEGAYVIRAEKTDFSKDFILVTSFDQPLSFSLSHNSFSLGKAENSGHAEEPVTTSLGNFTLSATDLSFKGRGLNFSFERFYNSQDTYSGPLGHGWTHNYNIKLTQTADVVTIKFADGHEEFYVEQQGGGFKPQPGIHKDLVKNADGTFHLTDKALTTYSFDPSGRLSNITDRNGNTIALNYDNGNLVNVTDPVGRNVDFTYDAEGRIVQLTDHINRTVTFEYDSNGDLISVTDPMGFETVYTYDGKHQMTSATNPRGYTFVSNTYDEERRVVTAQSDALGNTSRFSYDDREHITIITDPLGNRTVHRHDNKHRLIEITDAMRNKVLYEYDNDNNRTKVTDRRGSITRITYDDRANPTQITDPLGNVTTITYDQNDNPLEKIDPLGNKTRFEYDANGNLAKIVDALGNETTIERNQNGQPVRITDVRGNQTEFTYDTKGNLIKKKDPLGFEVSYAYDGVGRRISGTDQLGRTTSYEYDNNDHLIKVTDPSPFGYSVVNTYDENGNLVTMTDRRGNTTSFAYDQKDRLTSITDPLGNAISFTYDALDRRISRTDKRGNTTTYKYDALGRVIEITDPLGSKIKRAYDSEGNVLSEEDNQGNTWSYSYDALNRLITARDPLANEKTYEYDALGRLVKKTDPNGYATEYQYDALGRLVKVVEPGGGETQFTYDPAGNRVRFTNAIGNSFSSEYDDLNRIVRDADGYQYEYDGAGNLISKTDAKGQQIAYAYDELNRLKEIHYPDDSVVSFVYDPNGNLVTVVDPLGTTSRQYDAMNRLTQVTDLFGNTVKYSYDQEGNRSSITYPDNTTVTYEYDEANRLSSVTDWAERTTTYQYNSTGNVAQIILPNGCRATMSYDNARRLVALNNQQADNSVICSYDMTLDKAGNRTAIDKLEPLVPFIKNREVTYQYDSQNQLVSMTDGSFSFDENGSMTAKVSGSRSYNFTWNYDNRLKEWSVGGRTVSYNYDGLRKRITRTEDGNVTRYILDDSTALSNVLAETDANGNITAKYIYGLGLIAREDVQGIHYYHYDPIGSTIALTDATGQVTDKYAYDPFGALANRAGKTENPFAFVGKYGLMDEGEGLYYVRARYYDSELGRFLSRDILFGDPMDPQTLHRYVYGENDPIGSLDFAGLCSSRFIGSSDKLVALLGGLALNVNREIVRRSFMGLLNNVGKMSNQQYLQHSKMLNVLTKTETVLTTISLYQEILKEMRAERISINDWLNVESWLNLFGSQYLTVDDWLDSLAKGTASLTAVSWNTATAPFNEVIKLITREEIDIAFSGEDIYRFLKDPVPILRMTWGAWKSAWGNIKWAYGHD